MKFIKYILRFLLYLLLWLLCPFLLLIIPKPIKKFWIRLILFMLSPIMILIYVETFNYLERRYKYNQKEIECIIGIELPALEYVEYEEEELNTHLLKGHSMTMKLEFFQIPKQNFYNKLDSLCNIGNKGWITEEHNSILDSIIKSNGINWTEYYIGDRKEEMDSIAKQIMLVNKIQPMHYEFSGDLKLYIKKGSKYATLEYIDWEFQKGFLSN